MIALLSGAWWAQKLAAPAIQAAGAAIASTVVVGAVVGGLVWLRADARRDVEAANVRLEARLGVVEAAAAQQAETYRRRAESLDADRARLEDLKREMEERRHASPNPDAIVIPPGDPWLGPRARARGVRQHP
jgi:hypothetical protein